MKKKIFIITGEESGDKLASIIFSRLDITNYEIKAIGGENLKNLNFPIIFDNKKITFFGITAVIKNIFKIINIINYTANQCIKFKPDLIFSVDCPDFSFRVIEKVKKKIKTKAYHFVAPTIWSWREKRALKIKKIIDHIFLLFPFEKYYFDKYNISNSFVGHPYFLNYNNNYQNSSNDNIITICPGSRKSELNQMLPILIRVIKKINKNYVFHFPATSQTFEYLNNVLKKQNFKFVLSQNEQDKSRYIKDSIISIAKSGTISLDICKNMCPLITIYKMTNLNYLLIKPFVKVKFVNIINIIAGKEIIPELIQFDCTVDKISSLVLKYLENKNLRTKNVQNYLNIINQFANKNTDTKIIEYLQKNL